MDQSTTLSVRKIRYVRDNIPARVRVVRKGGTYTAGGIEKSGARGHSRVQKGKGCKK